jgi:hypothetical protein
MILDANLRLSNAQAITATADSTNMIDQKIANRDAGTGKPLFLVVVITTAMTNTGTVEVKLQGDSTSTMTPDKARSLFIIPAGSAVGDTFISPLHPRGDVEQYRYINISYTVSGTVSTGNATAFITQDVQAWVAKANNYTIS